MQRNGDKWLGQHDELRSAYAKLQTECEQRFVELESEYTECQRRLGDESRDAHAYRTRVDECDARVAELLKQLNAAENERAMATSTQQRLTLCNANLEAEKRELHIMLGKKIKDNDQLNEEWKAMNAKLSAADARIAELSVRAETTEAREASLALRDKHFEADKQRLLNEVDWLNKQLSDKSAHILELRATFNARTYALESQCDELQAECKRHASLAASLQSANESMEAQLADITGKMQTVREQEARSRIAYADEAESRERLIELYKEEAASGKQKLAEAADAIGELKALVDEVKREYESVCEEKARADAAYEAKMRETDETIGKLEQELKNANDLLSIAKRKGAHVLAEADIEQLSPAAAVASRLLKSGMSLTQIYSEYVNQSEALTSERAECERLRAYIGELVRDMEEKAPVLRRQRLEYEEAVKTVHKLTAQLENAMMDYEMLKSKSEEAIKKYNMVASDNVRYKQDVSDLSRQCVVLLGEIETLRAKSMAQRHANRSFKQQHQQQADMPDTSGYSHFLLVIISAT